MINEGKFGSYEAVWMLSLFCCAKTILSFPRTMIEYGGTAGWFIPIISGLFGFLGFLIIIGLLKRFPGLTIVEAGKNAAGPVVGSIAALLYMMLFITITGTTLREFSESLKVMSLPVTPLAVILITIIITAAVCAHLGLETYSRLTLFIAIPMLVIIVLIIVLTFNQYNINYLLPILGKGPENLFLYGIMRITNFSELLFAGLIVNNVGGYKNCFKAGVYSIILATAVSAIVTAAVIMTFNVKMSEELFFPLLRLAKEISIGRFFQRCEAAFEIFWVSVILIYCVFGIYSSSVIFARTFKIKSYKPLIPIFTVIITIIAFLPHDMKATFLFDSDVNRKYSSIIAFGVPLIILIIAILRKKRIKNTGGGEVRSL